ncbi:FAD/NAD(P)-binding protein [Pedobacter sp. SL55]|uniref:FAD/NAD(P)-binding protein n=1 Tax=Pedobacter sp. SL55 TaxID=2995161 RepID=UPI00226F244B|nr:FAD/NAD(P)-binding protein [Pedobacter sp. SL55]WAC40058.1 FAD/NAD(P)-binding protein [Pedobacter sp. SL55]
MKKNNNLTEKQIAIVGGGPSGLFMLKKIIDAGLNGVSVTVFEKGKQLGAGMPYSASGANDEHVTNVSANEIPELAQSIGEWIQQVHPHTLARFKIDLSHFHNYKVLPRLLFGEYLTDQFALIAKKAISNGIDLQISYNSKVVDILDQPAAKNVTVVLADKSSFTFDHVVLCSGHLWPKHHEGKVKGYYDSPYPPAKIKQTLNHPVAIRGASLTAIDAIRTLARAHGNYQISEQGMLQYELKDQKSKFKIVLHSREGLLPGVRFHLEESILGKESLFTPDEINIIRKANEGFVLLDLAFEEKFLKPLSQQDPAFYEKIKDLSMEDFVDEVMELRERLDAFQLFRAEYREAAQSIRRRQSVYWKELLCALSYTLNYPAKYFSAEDMLRLKKKLMPLISLLIAFVPQSSAEELLALHSAGVLDLIAVGAESKVVPKLEGGITYHYTNEQGEEKMVEYDTFVDCIGQPHLSFDDIPFPGLKERGTIAPAKLQFRVQALSNNLMEENRDIEMGVDGKYYLKVPGLAINDHFQVVDQYLALNPRIYVMAVPFIGGYNPDYSGLDFCETAATQIAKSLTMLA